MQEGKLGGMLGYEKGINIFLFPTFHDIILIDFSNILGANRIENE
jgi:hypothetical protein